MIHSGRPPGEPLFHDPSVCRGCRAKARTARAAHQAARHTRHYVGHMIYEMGPGVLAIICFEWARDEGLLATLFRLSGPHQG